MEAEIKKGCFGYTPGNEILTNISFTLSAGNILTILGPNGIGKTTLLKCIIGILKWDRGETRIDGDLMNFKKHMHRIGYVPQSYKFVFPYTVEETVAMGRVQSISLFSMPSRLDSMKVDESLNAVGIIHLKKRLCSNLSGGQLQLVFIARALAKSPELLILDEPESQLDYKNQILVLRMLEKLVRERNLSCIINTHYPDHALRISDQTLIQGISKSGETIYIHGQTENIITEENIQSFFDVEARIISLDRKDRNPLRTLVITE